MPPPPPPEYVTFSFLRCILVTCCKLQVLSESRPPPNASIIDNLANLDFRLQTPGSGRWSGLSAKFNLLVPGPCPTTPRNFVKIRSQLFQLSNGQTDRQTDRSENITSFFGGGNNQSYDLYFQNMDAGEHDIGSKSSSSSQYHRVAWVTMGDFTFWLSPWLSLLAESKH